MACNVLIGRLRCLQVDMQDQDSIDVMIHQVRRDRALLQHPCTADHAFYSKLQPCCRWEASTAQHSAQPYDLSVPSKQGSCMCS